MRIFGRNFQLTKRSSTAPWAPSDDRWYSSVLSALYKGNSAVVTPETAAMNPIVYACVKVLSESLASAPLSLYQRKGDKRKERALDLNLYTILRSQVNPYMTAFEFKEMMTAHCLLRGNAYAQIIWREDNDVEALYPLDPRRMQPFWYVEDEGVEPVVKYKYQKSNGTTHIFHAEEVFHLRAASDGGLTAKPPIVHFAAAIGLFSNIESYSSNFYASNAAPSGILTLGAGQELSPKAKEQLKKDWKEKHGGAYRAGNIAILEEGMSWQQVGMSAVDAQLVEQMDKQATTICGCFRVPPHMIGILENASESNIEHQGIEFYTGGLLPNAVRWEESVARDLLRKKKPGKFFVEFNFDHMLRGDITTRTKAYAVGRQWGWLSVNDIRAKENEDPIEGGDTYLQPLNMIEASKAMDYLMSKNSNTNEPGTKNVLDDPSNPTVSNNSAENSIAEERVKTDKNAQELREKQLILLRNANISCFSEIIGRVVRREVNAAKTAERKGSGAEMESEFYPAHWTFTEEALRAAVDNYATQLTIFCEKPESSSATKARCLRSFVEWYDAQYRVYAEGRYWDISHDFDLRVAEMAGRLAKTVEDAL